MASHIVVPQRGNRWARLVFEYRLEDEAILKCGGLEFGHPVRSVSELRCVLRGLKKRGERSGCRSNGRVTIDKEWKPVKKVVVEVFRQSLTVATHETTSRHRSLSAAFLCQISCRRRKSSPTYMSTPLKKASRRRPGTSRVVWKPRDHVRKTEKPRRWSWERPTGRNTQVHQSILATSRAVLYTTARLERFFLVVVLRSCWVHRRVGPVWVAASTVGFSLSSWSMWWKVWRRIPSHKR